MNNTPAVALTDFISGLDLAPSHPLLLYNCGVTLIRLDQCREALDRLGAAFESTATFPTENDSVKQALKEAILHTSALGHYQLKEYSNTMTCFKHLLELRPQHATTVNVLLTMALCCYHL